SDLDLDTRSHAASSHGTERMGIPQADSFVPINPLVAQKAVSDALVALERANSVGWTKHGQ
ncbi:hypothetical protein ACFFJ0_12365, partial [Sphingobium scionense]